jgi:hypothetical protein
MSAPSCIKGGPVSVQRHHLSSPSTTTTTTLNHIVVLLNCHPLHLEHAVHSPCGRKKWGAFPVRMEGPYGVGKDYRTGVLLDSSIAITQLTPACSDANLFNDRPPGGPRSNVKRVTRTPGG